MNEDEVRTIKSIEAIAQELKATTIRIWIPGRGVGKARPRFSSKGSVHTARNYGRWKAEAIAHLRKIKFRNIPQPCQVNCEFVNFKSSDADNLIGSVLDALVQAEVIMNDSSSYVSGCSGKFVQWKKQRGVDKQVGILVEILSSEIERRSPPEFLVLGMKCDR